MNPLAILKSLFELVQGEDDPSHIAAGFALGASLGLVPKSNLLAVIYFLLFFFFRVEKGMAVISALIFTPLGYLVDPLAHRIGFALLTTGALRPLWTRLYNLPVVPWTRFNNTVVLGNLILGLLLYYPLYAAGMAGVAYYRRRWKATIDGLPVMRAINETRWMRALMRWTGKAKA